jgi:serine/threonine protein kinase
MPHPSFIARYEVLGLLGAGGMGAVYRARDPQIGGRLVAIKLLRRDQYADVSETTQLRQRFVQEAHAAGRIESDHVVRIFDVGEHEGEPFIAMEFIDGETLAALVKRREPMPLSRKLELISHLCEGVAAAHECGIVHRDIKPLNIVVDRRGRLKILDFGIAKMTDSGMHTATGFFMGSCNYVSPEQASGSSTLDLRSDIFSIGAVAYELLCYRQAFSGGPPGVLHKIISAVPEPLLEAYSASDALVPGEERSLDPEIERIVLRALEKDPSRRYQDAAAMRQEVEDARRRLMSVPALREEPAPPSGRSKIAQVATVPTPRVPQSVVAVSETLQSPAAGVRVVEKPPEEPVTVERRAWTRRTRVALLIVALAIGATVVYMLRMSGWPSNAGSASNSTSIGAPTRAEQSPPSPDAEQWAAAVKAQTAEAYEAYLRFLKERGIQGEHRAEAQAKLASMWAPQSAPAFQIESGGSVLRPVGYLGRGCTKPIPTRYETEWSADGKVALYSTYRGCPNDSLVTVIEIEGQPAFEFPGIGGDGGTRALSSDGQWVAQLSYSHGLVVMNVRDRRLVTLKPLDRKDFSNAEWGRVAISRDGSTVAVGFSGTERVAVYDRGTRRGEILPMPGGVDSKDIFMSLLSMSSNGKFIAYEITNSSVDAPGVIFPDFYLYDRDAKRATLVAQRSEEVYGYNGFRDRGGVLVSDTGEWIVFTSRINDLSQLRDAPAATSLHLYARHVATGRTWLIHSEGKATPVMKFDLVGGSTLFLAAAETLPTESTTSMSRSERSAQPAEMSWRTLPNGAVSTRSTQYGQVLASGLGPNLNCALMTDRTLLCPVR